MRVCNDPEGGGGGEIGGTLAFTDVDNDVDGAEEEDSTDKQDEDDYAAFYGVIL